MDATGDDLRRLTRTRKIVIDTHPSFSPDGRQIAFASTRVKAGGRVSRRRPLVSPGVDLPGQRR